MMFQRFDDRYQVRLESGDQLIGSLLELLRSEGIGYASLTGLGAVRRASLAYYDVVRKEYETQDIEEQLEVTSLVGNATLKDDEPFLHLHATLGRRDLSVIGGHLMEAVAHSTVEVWLQREEQPVRRAFDEESGLSLMQLPRTLAS